MKRNHLTLKVSMHTVFYFDIFPENIEIKHSVHTNFQSKMVCTLCFISIFFQKMNIQNNLYLLMQIKKKLCMFMNS